MTQILKACVDRILPQTALIRAAKRAIEENPVNAPVSGRRSGGPGMQLVRPWLALSTSRLWENGRRLRVRFLDGHPAVQERVAEAAREWSQYANITFDFGNDPGAEIRISFKEPGSWSFMGTDASCAAPSWDISRANGFRLSHQCSFAPEKSGIDQAQHFPPAEWS